MLEKLQMLSMQLFKFCSFAVLLSFISTSLQAQSRTVSGKVTDELNEPLPGVSISVKGGNTGTITDVEGNYSLSVRDASTVLIYSYIGFATREVEVGQQNEIDIQLEVSATSLDEVVVVGYGTQKKSEVIGSVSQVNGEKINDRTTPQLQQALTGQLPGVTVIQRSGQPGAPGGSIQIRGVGSFGAGTAPLILVDGIPVNSMNDINPNDVAKVSVLKDASSAAIYGSRAANGVILISTKSARSEGLSVSYNGYVGVQKPTAYPEFVNSWEYAELLNEATGGGGGYTEEEIQAFRDGSNPDQYPNVDYIERIFKNSVLQTGHNFSVSNRNKNSEYVLSLGYMYQNGIIAKNDYNRTNVRLNLVNDLTDNITLTTRLSAIQITDDQPNSPARITGAGTGILGIIGYAVRFPPIYPDILSNGDFGTGLVGTGTPVSFLASDSFFKGKTMDLNGNLRLDWNILDNLKASVIAGYTQRDKRNDVFSASQRLNDNVFLSPSTLRVNNIFDNYKTLQQLLEYTTTFGKHRLNFLAGHSFEEFYNENSSAYRINFPSNDIVVIDAGDVDGQVAGGSATEYALDSYFGRVRYNYADKYLLEGTFRYDGSSRFPTNNKYAFFPSGAVGWVLSEEPFLRNVNFVNDLKLRASYGVLGNQNISNYPYQEILSTGYNYGFGNTVRPGVANTKLVDPTIHWESTRTYDIGVDAQLFEGQLSFGATYYNRYTYDILVSPNSSVSNVLGFGIGDVNSGSLENRGWEFTAGHSKVVGDFSFSVSANFSIVNNEVLDLGVANVTQPNGLVGNGSNRFIGYPLGIYYGYKTDGLYVDETDVDEYTAMYDQSALNPSPEPGDMKYRDISGPEGVPDGKVDATYDRTILGSTIPKYSYGVNLSAKYKGFQLSALIQAVSGVQGRLVDHAGYAFATQDGNVQRWQMEERWTQEDPDPNAGYPRIELVPNAGTPNTMLSDFWVLNASYIKLRNIRLAYTLPAAFVDKIGFKQLGVNLSAENLVTISNYREGWDPEINADRKNYYPIMTNFTLGVTANF